MPGHVTLLGDSVFDNRAYVGRDPDVPAHLRALLPSWEVTLCAVDGATTTDVGYQFGRVPSSTTHLVLSLGGNDALENADLLSLSVRTTGEALDRFGERLAAFEQSYRFALEGTLDLGFPTVVCTIYNGNLAEPEARRARVALMMFNDTIVRQARQLDVDVIELRSVCNEPADFANPIEPSGTGGLKIATAVARAIGAATETTPSTVSP